MLLLPLSLSAWNTDSFETVFKDEIKQLDSALLPLQQGLTHSNTANGDSLSLRIIHVDALPDRLLIQAGLFYTGIIAGCSCSDDPTPNDEINEYCEVRFDIDRKTGEASVTLLTE